MIELPGYIIERQLGRGGMARVYLARHIGLDRLVAIKVLSKDLHGDKSFSERFMREARIVANLTHHNIITVHDVGVHNEFHYIAMEYLPGVTLDDKIKSKLNIKQVLGITKQIAAALDFAHKKDIIHRDVKPDNILFREDGTAVLTDFGIARATKSETKMTATGTVIGTPHYMSPEQAQGQDIGPWSDLYSLGIVLFEMLSGEVPFDADSTIAVVFKHITEPVPNLDEAFEQYQSLVNTLLAKEPGARYQTGREVIADIECLERGDTPANATLIFNQTAINPTVDLNTDKIDSGNQAKQQQNKSGTSKLFISFAVISVALIAVASTLFLSSQNTQNIGNDIPSQRELNLAYEEQELKKRQKVLEEKTANNAAAEQRTAQDKRQQEELKRTQREQLALQKQAEAEAEARKAKQELQALKKQTAKQQAAASKPEPAPVTQQVPIDTTENTVVITAPPTPKPKKRGLLSGFLGSSDDNTDEYIKDLFKAADNALSTRHYASAKQNYATILKLEPTNQRARQGFKKANTQQSSNNTGNDDNTSAYIKDTLKAADNSLSGNRLSSARANYQTVLKHSPTNKRARIGLSRVFNGYLKLAAAEARDGDYDDAEEYLAEARKIKPNNEKLKIASEKLLQLKNK